MSRMRFSVLSILALLFALAPGWPGAASAQGMGPSVRGCGAEQPSVPATAIAELPVVTVNIYDGVYAPGDVTVRPGTIVMWVNRGRAPHTGSLWVSAKHPMAKPVTDFTCTQWHD